VNRSTTRPAHSRSGHTTKKDALADAGVPFFRSVHLDRPGRPTITAHRLVQGVYVAKDRRYPVRP
jgi:hypothetical protein